MKSGLSASVSTILFDLDDTLYLERDFAFSGFKSVATLLEMEYGFIGEQVWHVMVELFEQGERKRVFDRALLRIDIEPDHRLISRLVHTYRHHFPSISMADDAVGILRWAFGKFKLGIITDGYKPMQNNKVDALNLQTWMDVVIYTDDLGPEHWKPSPRPFREALQRVGGQPTQAIYVADNPYKDFVGARSLGMGTVRIKRPGGLHADVTLGSEREADYEITNLLSLIDLLTGCGSADGYL